MIRLCHVVLVLALAVPGKALSQTGNASHPDDAHRLAVLARDVWAPVELASLGFQTRDPNATVSAERLRRACLLNEAAGRRDPLCQSAARDLCLLHTSAAIDDPGRAAESIARYSSLQPQDAYPVEIWLRFRLDHLGNRKAKEEFLRQTLPALRDYPLIRSQAMTELGNLALEKGLIDDMPATTEAVAQRGARSWFTQAFYESSLYNLNAMERLLALPEPDLSPSLAGADEEQLQQQQQAVRDERTLYTALRWRLTLRNDPFNPAAADQLVRTLESLGKFQLAQQYYPHLIHLLEQETLSAQARRDVRLRQLRGAYLAGLHRQAVDLARQMLNDEPDDVLAGAVLALALRRLDMPEEADAALQRVTSVNLEQMQQAQTPPPSQLLEMAWLFCFVDPDPEQALRLAQQACPENTDTPVSARCAAIRAYAHLLNQEPQQAQTSLEQADPNDPITTIARARLLLDQDQPEQASKLLEEVSPASLGILIETARQLAAQLPDGVPAVLQPRDPDSETPDLIDNTFAAQFDNNELQLARDPAKALRCSVSLSSDIVGYGESLAATIYLANVSDSNRLPAVFLLGPNGFLDPHVIVVASIAPADNPQDVQTAILSHRYLVSQRLLGPGQTNSVEEYLNIGPIRSILRDHPQRTYEVTFQAILDPVPDGQGGFRPRLPSIQPQPVVVTRTGFAPTRDRIRTQLLAARSGSTGERIHAVELLAGLVREADRARRSQLGYTPLPIDRDALVQAIAANLGHVEPRVRAWAAYALVSLGAPATPEQARGLSNCLNDENWFPRFLAVHCLAPITDLSEYLRWTAPTETDVLLRRQILLLQGKPWPTITLPEPGTSQAPATEQTASPPATSLGYSPTPVSPPITPDPALPTS